MTNENDLPQRDRWARLRFAIIGPLLASPPPAGELRAALADLAAKTWRHPGFELRFGVSTLERWRYLKAHGLVRRRTPRRGSVTAIAARDRLEQREVRSYEVEHVLQLVHLDFHHGSRKVLSRRGEYLKPLLVAFIDDRSRFLCHAQWYTSEGTEELVHGLCQALQKVGLPRSLMSDRGSAMIAGEFTAGLHRLSILHLPTLPYSPHVNGKQENLWARVRLLASARLDSQSLLCIVLAGDTRLLEKLRREELLACLELRVFAAPETKSPRRAVAGAR